MNSWPAGSPARSQRRVALARELCQSLVGKPPSTGVDCFHIRLVFFFVIRKYAIAMD